MSFGNEPSEGAGHLDAAATTPLEAIWLGRMGFEEALRLQIDRREAIASGSAGPALFLVEHPPTLTIGRRGSRSDILWTDEQLRAAGVAVSDTPRGGQVTLHAPGQLVAYPVLHVGRGLRQFLEDLAQTTVDLFETLGVQEAYYRPDHPGVWLGEVKLASIGIHVSRGISVQGIAMNLNVDPTLFGALVSCGLDGVSVVSATTVGGRAISPAEAAQVWAPRFATRRNTDLVWVESVGQEPSAARVVSSDQCLVRDRAGEV